MGFAFFPINFLIILLNYLVLVVVCFTRPKVLMTTWEKKLCSLNVHLIINDPLLNIKHIDSIPKKCQYYILCGDFKKNSQVDLDDFKSNEKFEN